MDSDKRWETEMVSVFKKVFPDKDEILMDLYRFFEISIDL